MADGETPEEDGPFKVWSYAEAARAAPYVRTLLVSVREHRTDSANPAGGASRLRPVVVFLGHFEQLMAACDFRRHFGDG